MVKGQTLMVRTLIIQNHLLEDYDPQASWFAGDLENLKGNIEQGRASQSRFGKDIPDSRECQDIVAIPEITEKLHARGIIG